MVDREYLVTDAHLEPLRTAIHDRLCAGADPSSLHTLNVQGLSTVGVANLRTWLDTTTRRRRGNSAVGTSCGVTSVPVRELLSVLDVGVDEVRSLVERALGRRW